MTLFIKIMIGLMALGIVSNIALIGQARKPATYTIGSAIATLIFNTIVIYGLIFWT